MVKCLLHCRPMDIASLLWGKTHKEDVHQAYIAHMALQGQAVAVQDCGLVIYKYPVLPIALMAEWQVTNDRGLLKIKWPYTAIEEELIPLQAAKDIKGFCCKQSTINQGTKELKCWLLLPGLRTTRHYQTCMVRFLQLDNISIHRGVHQSQFHPWEEIKDKLIQLHCKAILLELALPRFTHWQPICWQF